MSELEIRGPGASPELKEEIVGYLEEKKERFRSGLPEKTKEEAFYIAKFNNLLNSEFKELGVAGEVNISPDDIDFIEDYKIRTIKGGSSAVGDFIKVWTNKLWDRSNKYHYLLHEMVHHAAYRQLRTGEVSGHTDILSQRSGYETTHLKDGEPKEIKTLGALNEAITQKLTLELLSKNKEELEKSGKFKFETGAYKRHIEILNIIINEISRVSGVSEEEVWKTIKRGYFSGEMMHLRSVEKTFGKGALKILAGLKGEDGRFLEYGRYSKTKKYFSTQNKAAREETAKKLLKK